LGDTQGWRTVDDLTIKPTLTLRHTGNIAREIYIFLKLQEQEWVKKKLQQYILEKYYKKNTDFSMNNTLAEFNTLDQIRKITQTSENMYKM
jgi:hypothetical protein